jgi:hypothetical protein
MQGHELAIDEPFGGHEGLFRTEQGLGAPVTHENRLAGGQGCITLGAVVAKGTCLDPHRAACDPPVPDGPKDRHAAVARDDATARPKSGDTHFAVERHDERAAEKARLMLYNVKRG